MQGHKTLTLCYLSAFFSAAFLVLILCCELVLMNSLILFILCHSNGAFHVLRKEMAKGTRGRRRIASRQCRPTPYPLPLYNEVDCVKQKKFPNIFRKDWEDATCSVCMEFPHNAVLLLCSSHEKGCRPYMCGTSLRHSNCLDQYKKAYSKASSSDNFDSGRSLENPEGTELACPLCRGQVKGWTVVKPARDHLNAKKRSCMQDNCSFVGTYKELQKHVKAEHPCARPREVDPTLEQKWRRLERKREREDVMGTIRSSMPGAVFFGDYVIEGNQYGFDSDDDEEEEDFEADAMERNEGVEVGIDRNLMSVFLFLQAFGSAGNAGSNRGVRRHEREPTVSVNREAARFSNSSFDHSGPNLNNESDNDNEDNGEYGTSLVGRLLRHQGRVLLGRSGRRRRRREATRGEDRL